MMRAGLVCFTLCVARALAGAAVYEAEQCNASYGMSARVADQGASGGAAVACRAGVHPAGKFVFATRYYPTLPGRYRATWRLRVPDHTQAKPVISLDAIQPGDKPGLAYRAVLKGTDFAASNRWQTFTYEFDRTELGRVQYRGRYLGGDVDIDRLVVERLRGFTDKELYPMVVKEYPLTVPKDVGALWRAKRDARLDVLELRGVVLDNLWQMDKAAKALGRVRFDSRRWTKVWHKALERGHYFPADYQTLFAYDVVVMTCGDALRVQATGRRMLESFVRAGGGLIVLGGYMSYGKARAKGTVFERMLPVELGTPWDLSGGRHRPIERLPDAPRAFRFPSGWRAQCFHKVTLRDGAKVAWRLGERPALVYWTYGTGRVVCLVLPALGTPDKSGPLFYDTPAWPAALARIITWSAEPARGTQR